MARGIEEPGNSSCSTDIEAPSLLALEAPAKADQAPWNDFALPDEEVASWPLHDRMGRVGRLIDESNAIVDRAIDKFIVSEGKSVAGTVILFSGGNDSTVMAHLMRPRATHAGMANTGIGIEETRQFVRDTCALWGLPLLERCADAHDSYAALVLDQGFPGPGHHYKMFQRLKERAFRKLRSELVTDPRRERVIFLAGRRRQESSRRASIPDSERVGSIVWVSPMVNWTKPDLTTYRQMFEVPRNEVADLIHMSGECLCGAFAHEHERMEIEPWFPAPFSLIDWLEEQIKDRPDIPEHRKRWGWGGDEEVLKASRHQRERAGYLCGNCPSKLAERAQQLRLKGVA